MEEKELITRAARGDRDAFSLLAERYLPVVYRQILGTAADPDMAFDLTRETFLRAWHGISLFQQDVPFVRWLLNLAEDVAGVPETDRENAGEAPVPEQLHGAILRRIEQERGGAVWRETLGRFRFTLAALLLVLILLLFSRLSGRTGRKTPSPAPQPSAAATPVLDLDAALEPGT